jgi:hypothetical protein
MWVIVCLLREIARQSLTAVLAGQAEQGQRVRKSTQRWGVSWKQMELIASFYKPDAIDCYTFVFDELNPGDYHTMLAMSEDGHTFSQWTSGRYEAVAFAQESPSDRLNAGTLDWMRALLLHERGELMPALLPSVRAADAYFALGSPESAARAQQLAAAIMLDLAESLPSGTERNSYIDMAAPYVRRCLRVLLGFVSYWRAAFSLERTVRR